MRANPERIECALQDDARLIVAVGVAVSHSASRAGLSEQEQEESAAAAVDACREIFALIHGQERSNPSLQMVVESFPDHIVLMIDYSGEPPIPACSGSRRDDSSAGPARTRGALPKAAGFDCVRYDTSDGRCRITMTKYGKLKSKLMD
ncbi:MAG TPA: hypothetical protein VNE63_15260 [Candidatus Acidoferrales bacterium]|nr:hypothetical protein [Candidatus Acidoferrales bacterium]